MGFDKEREGERGGRGERFGKKKKKKRTLTFLFERQLSLFIVIFVLPSTPIFTSLLIPRAKKNSLPLR